MKHNLLHFLRGFLMGLAAATPFLSIATAAFLLGSYQNLLNAVRSIFSSIGHLLRGKPDLAVQGFEWEFLLLTAVGIFLGGFALPELKVFVEWYTLQLPRIYSVICGMIFGSLGYAFYEQRGGNLLSFMAFISGIAGSITMMLITPEPLSASWVNLFLMGLLGVLANFVPAVPDGYMDTLLGGYQFIAYYWGYGYWPILAACALGALLAVLFLVFVVTRALTKQRDVWMSLGMGMLAGLIFQIWPLKFMPSHRDGPMLIVGICFMVGCTISSLLHKHQQKTLG